jgi:pyruvate/2-oxoglutarate dehydrogenase complex dihydrolipoamide acyltransferase (E2) component
MAVVEVTLPKWGMTMQEGTIEAWLKNVGDRVEEGDVVAEVTTEKVNAEVEAPVAGVVTELLVEVGATVEVGTPIALIEDGAS